MYYNSPVAIIDHKSIEIFLGSMKREIKCYWGNRKCLRYTNKPEVKNYCDDPLVKYSFCVVSDSENYSITNSTTDQTRTFRYHNGLERKREREKERKREREKERKREREKERERE
jgi:hypothetical protein